MSDFWDTAASEPAVPPAGWYPDPSDPARQRYWDGAAWTDHTVATGVQPFEVTPTSQLSGTIRRLVAFSIDIGMFALTGFLLGFLFFDQLATLGAWGRVIGFAVTLVYFTVLDSGIGGGRTLGKRLLKIRVVDRTGDPISPLKAAARYTVLAGVTFLNGLPIPVTRIPMVVTYLISIVLFGLIGANIYLLFFNRRTKQFVHDLAVGSFVTRSESAGTVKTEFWKPHLIVLGVWLAIVAGGGIVLTFYASDVLPEGMYEALAKIEGSSGVQNASIMYTTWYTSTGETSHSVTLTVLLAEEPVSEDGLAAQYARIVLNEYPEANDVDAISVTLRRGFDLGFASGWRSVVIEAAPDEW